MSRGTAASVKGAKKRADVLFSKIVRAAGACRKCGSTTNLQTAHVISRRYSNTRCVLSNAFCLDAKCHMFFTDHPVEWANFVLQEIGQSEYERLYALSQSTAKVDWAVVAAELSVTAKNLGVAA